MRAVSMDGKLEGCEGQGALTVLSGWTKVQVRGCTTPRVDIWRMWGEETHSVWSRAATGCAMVEGFRIKEISLETPLTSDFRFRSRRGFSLGRGKRDRSRLVL